MSQTTCSFKPSDSVLPERFRSITKPSDFPIMPERFHSITKPSDFPIMPERFHSITKPSDFPIMPERFHSITKPSDFPIMPERFHSMRNAGQNANQKQYPQKALEEKMREMTEEMREELGRTPAFNDFIERLTRTYDKKKVEERLEAFAKAWIAVNGPIENIREVYNAHFSTMAYLMDTAPVSDHQVTVGELKPLRKIKHSNKSLRIKDMKNGQKKIQKNLIMTILKNIFRKNGDVGHPHFIRAVDKCPGIKFS